MKLNFETVIWIIWSSNIDNTKKILFWIMILPWKLYEVSKIQMEIV